MNPPKRRVTVGLFIVALAAAACGGGSTSSTSTSAKPSRGFTGAPASGAPTVVVNCPTDNLQNALNAAQPGSTIMVRGTCTGHFSIHVKDLKLVGPATLDGGGVGPAPVLTVQDLSATLASLTIQRGLVDSPLAGGGIENSGGTLTIQASRVLNNNSGSGGGGIDNEGHGVMTLNDSQVSGNTAVVEGGGIRNFNGTMTLNNSQVSKNTASGSSSTGGGIANFASGTITLNHSQVSGNTAVVGGGGIFNADTVNLQQASLVSDNHPDNCHPTNSVPGCSG
jgi:hypothetical protein